MSTSNATQMLLKYVAINVRRNQTDEDSRKTK